MAAKADGSINIKVDLDEKEAQRELTKLTRDIEKTKDKLNEQKGKQSSIKAELESAKDEALKTEAAVRRLREALAREKQITSGAGTTSPQEFMDSQARQAQLEAQLREQESLLKRQDAEAEKLGKQYTKITDDVIATTEQLDKAETRAGELAQQMTQAGRGSEALEKATKKARKQMDTFGKRLASVVRSALIFTVITKALAAFRDWMSRVVKTSDEATAALAKLKGALLTMVQPLVNVIIPAFTALVNVATDVVMALARLFSWLSGTSVEANAEAAESLYNEMEALEGVGSAAKDAQKQLAGFDEINKLSDSSQGSGGTGDKIAPDFNVGEYSDVSDTLEDILWTVLAIGTGLLAWRIASMFTSSLALIAGIALMAGGAVLMLKNFIEAWINGIDSGNFIGIIAGFTAIIAGLYLAFGQTAAAIGLVVGGAALLVLGIKDIIDNGVNLQNVLMTIAGLFAVGLGISLLVGSWIPLLVAAILGIIVAVTTVGGSFEQLISGIKLIFGGLIDFITGVFTGDWERAWEGCKNIFKGIINTILAIAGGFVNAAIKGINWLIEKINSIDITIPDWVPLLGGKGFAPNIPKVREWQVPYLAQGAVIPANREFLAVLGDQKSGTNIETPLDTMLQAFRQALSEMGGGNNVPVKLYLDGKVIAETVSRYQRNAERAGG